MKFPGGWSRPRAFPVWAVLLVVPAVVSAAAFLCVGRYGPGVSGDSFTYTSMAKHIAAGQGASYYNNTTGGRSLPMTWFAPLWPAVLSPLQHLKIPYQQSSLALLAALLFGNLWLAGLITRGVTGRAGPAVCLQTLFAADANWLTWHFYLLTEALFFMQINLAIYFVWRYSRDERLVWLWWTVVTGSLFALNRYIGVVLVPAFLFILWVSPRVSRRSSVRAAVAGVVMILPFAAWLWRNYQFTGIGYDKSLPGVDTSRYFVVEMAGSVLENIGRYAGRAVGGGGLAAAVELLVAAAAVWVCAKWVRGQARFALKVAVAAIIYVTGLWTAMTWRHMAGMSDEVRYLTPFYHMIWIALVAGVCGDRGPLPVRWVSWAAGAAWMTGCAAQFAVWCSRVWAAGVDGTAGRGWAFMSTIGWFP